MEVSPSEAPRGQASSRRTSSAKPEALRGDAWASGPTAERLIEEIRYRERVVRIFPNKQSVRRLFGVLLFERLTTYSTRLLYLPIQKPQ